MGRRILFLCVMTACASDEVPADNVPAPPITTPTTPGTTPPTTPTTPEPTTPTTTDSVVDADGDGSSNLFDCNDADAAIYPGAPQRLFVDADCDGTVDRQASLGDHVWWPSPWNANAGFGDSMVRAGDVDADGSPDIWVSSLEAETNVGRGHLGVALSSDPGADVSQSTRQILPTESQAVYGTYEFFEAIDDVDGDGLPEVVLAVNDDDDFQVVFFRSGEIGNATSVNAGSAWLTIPDAYSVTVRSVGDVDGDGLGDVAIGAPGPQNRRVIFFISGAVLVDASGLLDLNVAFATISGEDGSLDSSFMQGLGDLDGDGAGEVGVTTALGSTVGIFSGAALRGELGVLDARATISAWALFFGPYVDVDGDGLHDVFVVNHNGINILPGAALMGSGAIGLVVNTLATIEYGFDGVGPIQQVVGVGDHDGDGGSEIAVNSYGYGSASGTREIGLFRSSQLLGGAELAWADVAYKVEFDGDSRTIFGCGDANDDGVDDLAVATHQPDGIFVLTEPLP